MRDSMVFYKSFREAIKRLSPEDQLKAYDAIFDYAFEGKETNEGIVSAILLMAKPQIDANNQRYENGRKGGRPKTEPKPNDNQTETEPKPNKTNHEPNVNVNDNDNVNDNNISCAPESHGKEKKAIDERKMRNFEIIYKAYPKKKGKQGAIKHYLGWISQKGRCINGVYRHLTNEQIYAAVKKYVNQMESEDKDIQYYQGFDRFMNETILDYVEGDYDTS